VQRRRLAALDQPAQGGSQVVQVARQHVEPDGLLGATQVPQGLVDKTAEVLGVGVADRFGVAARLEPFARELAHGLEQAEADLAIAVVDAEEQVALDQVSQDVEDARGVRAADGLGGFERGAAGENGHALEHPLLFGRQQGVAPGDRFAQGAVALRRVAQARLQIEPALEAQRDRGRRDKARARGGKLDRQRQTVEFHADFGQGAGVVAAQGEVRPNGAGALDE